MTAPRIIAGLYKGRLLATPAGLTTRPTNTRARQAAFDILLHAPWAGPSFIQSTRVLDVFAGTGAYGLEALSRGATTATFMENNRDALTALRTNIQSCKAESVTKVIPADALNPPPGTPHNLIFLDPPYAQNLIPQALTALSKSNYFAPTTILIAELGPTETFSPPNILTTRQHGKARLIFWSNAPNIQ
jgi:16S rRNA (guanine966-N2)-methyltransferase